MKKYLSGIFILFILLTACETDNDTGPILTQCDVTSIQQLPWAQKLVTGKGPCTFIYEGAKITRYTYKGSTVFFFENMLSSLSICTMNVYNCLGDELINASSSQALWDDFNTNRKAPVVIWQKPL